MKWLIPVKRPRLAVIITGLILVMFILVLLPLLLLIKSITEERLVNDSVHLLKRVNGNWTARLDRNFYLAKDSIGRFAKIISHIPPPPSEDNARQFDTLVRQDADGAWRSRKESFSPAENAGIWLQKEHPVTLNQKSFLINVKTRTELFGKGSLGTQVNTWVLPKEGGIVIHWPTEPEFVYNATADFDYTDKEWVTITKPAVNPEGAPRWTSASFDPTPKIWMISAAAPFSRNGEWAGAVGHDLPFPYLVQQLHEVQAYPNTKYMLVRDDGVLLLSNQYNDRILATDGHFSIADTADHELIQCFQALPDVFAESLTYPHQGHNS